MSSSRICIAIATLGSLVGTACISTSSNTDLNPDGPPEIAQVRMMERYVNSDGTTATRVVFGFGTYPTATSDDEHPVTSAVAFDPALKLRIIVDELLLGNNLQEIECRGIVDNDAFDRVPVGDTPDDIARCAVASDALSETCPGKDPRSVCICKNDGGCGATAKGDPVGVLDVNQDGAADQQRFIQDAVGIQCGAIKVPIDLDQSYWNPSGDQQVPAKGGFDALGPAIVLVPGSLGGSPVLPTNITCNLTVDPSVVDKQNISMCAPPNGDYKADNSMACTPGDVSLVSWKTEVMTIHLQGINDNDVGVDRTADLIVNPNVPVDPTAFNNLTITENGAAFTNFTVSFPMPNLAQIHPTAVGGFAANAAYVITFPTTVTDSFHQGLPAPVVIHFTTGA